MKNETEKMLEEWLQYAQDDLESAGIILKESDNYHISVYHSHQSMEKVFKWFLLKNNIKFPFVHDLKELIRRVGEIQQIEAALLEEIIAVDGLYPQLRYPTGDKISKEDAMIALNTAKSICKYLVKGE